MSLKELIEEFINKRKLYAQLNAKERDTVGREILKDILKCQVQIKYLERTVYDDKSLK